MFNLLNQADRELHISDTQASSREFAGYLIAASNLKVAESLKNGFSLTSWRLGQIAESIKETGQNIANANERIAAGIFNMSQSIENGLGQIGNAIERSRMMEEYYKLLENIDILENALIKNGNDIKPFYDNMIDKYNKNNIELTDCELKLLVKYFLNSENMKWLEESITLNHNHPIQLFLELLENCVFRTQYYYKAVLATYEGVVFEIAEDYSQCCLCPDNIDDEIKWIKEFVWSIPSREEIVNWVENEMKSLAEQKILSTDELSTANQIVRIIEYQNACNSIACLKELYSILLSESKKIKFKN